MLLLMYMLTLNTIMNCLKFKVNVNVNVNVNLNIIY